MDFKFLGSSSKKLSNTDITWIQFPFGLLVQSDFMLARPFHTLIDKISLPNQRLMWRILAICPLSFVGSHSHKQVSTELPHWPRLHVSLTVAGAVQQLQPLPISATLRNCNAFCSKVTTYLFERLYSTRIMSL